MSVLVMSLCFKSEFGDANRKLVALALGDHADDDGGSVYPSVETIARKTDLSVRCVQDQLRELAGPEPKDGVPEADQQGRPLARIIEIVDAGGKGPGDTRKYKFNMWLLGQLASGSVELHEGLEPWIARDKCPKKGEHAAPSKGAGAAPIRQRWVQRTTLRVQIKTQKGAQFAPEPSVNHQESSARARASDLGSSPARATRRPERELRVNSTDPSWHAWVAHIRARDPSLAERVESQGHIIVERRWPDETVLLPVLDQDRARR
jgi:hypothetical protein